MSKIKKFAKTLWQDESAQGATEYILLLVIVVGIVFAFKSKIMGWVNGAMGGIDSKVSDINQ